MLSNYEKLRRKGSKKCNRKSQRTEWHFSEEVREQAQGPCGGKVFSRSWGEQVPSPKVGSCKVSIVV